ncbi:MAG: endolytic transglycosylase MltG [Microbacteriaceae bacterium]
MTNEPSWDDIFRNQPPETGAESASASAGAGDAAERPRTEEPQSRRELRDARPPRGSGREPKRPRRDRSVGSDNGYEKPQRRGRFAWLYVLLALIVVAGGTTYYGWTNYEPQIRKILGWELPNDFEGTGTSEEVVVVIQSGQIGEDVARTLAQQGVTMTYTAFYKLLLVQEPQVEFRPGNYSLHKEMSAQAALDALQDPANKITQRVTIPEGTTLPSALALLSAATDLPLSDFEAAAKDYVALGVPKAAPSLEGFLFPATYPLEPGQSAKDVLQVLVKEMFKRLDAAGVAPADRLRVLTMAALIQREAGSNPDDFYKVSRVFANRLATKGWKLESDASVAYGTGKLTTVWTTAAERADAKNKYNTYANPGLPIGPIGLPGDLAIDAAINPAQGPWFFFVPINLKTGETVFSETVTQHNAAVKKLQEWCRASADNKAYCA